MGEFDGFSRKAPGFFKGLAVENTKAWYKANESVYKDEVLAPMRALIETFAVSRQPYKFFRLNRDVRFSTDKSPYKLWQGALHRRPGGAINYFHIDADGLLAVAGMHEMTPQQIGRFRDAVAAERSGTALESILAALRKAGTRVESGMAAPLKRVPRGYDPEHRRGDLLKWKGLMCTRRFGVTKIGPKSGLPAALAAFWAETDALNAWLDQNVGSG